MAKVDDPRTSGWDEPPLPLKGRGKGVKRSSFRQLSLLHIMISLVYFAILSWSGKQILESDGLIHRIVFGVLVGLGFCVVGLWAAMKWSRYAFLGWVLFVIGYTTITGFTTTIFAVPTLPILIGAIIFLNLRRLSNNQDAFLWVLTVAAERGIPLAPGVRAFSGQVTGIFRIWSASLADLLDRGAPLPDALDSIPKLVPKRSSILIRTGWESGDLALGLREAVAARDSRQPILQAVGGRMAYLGWVAAVGLSVVGFVLYFIVPKFEAIFRDFGIPLPEMTILVIRASHVLVENAWVVALAFLAGLGYATLGLFGSGDLTVPGFDRFFARRQSILILRSLAVVVSAGRPIPPALDSLSRWFPTAWVRRKLALSAADAAQGMDWGSALHENGLLGASDVGVIAAARRAGNLTWALRELAETAERRRAYRLQAWNQVLFVVTMLVLGVLVFLLAVAFFMPLIALIERLAT